VHVVGDGVEVDLFDVAAIVQLNDRRGGLGVEVHRGVDQVEGDGFVGQLERDRFGAGLIDLDRFGAGEVERDLRHGEPTA
jgi:hypothetical protein